MSEDLTMINQSLSEPCAMTEWDLLKNSLTHKFYVYTTPFIIAVGLLGNIFSICVFILTDLKRQPVSIIIVALALADSFVLIMPVSIIWVETVFKRELTDRFSFWCRTHGFFDLSFTCTSSWLMVSVALERFCAVWLPHNNRTIFTHGRTTLLVLLIVSFSALSSVWFIFVLRMTNIEYSSSNNTSIIVSRCIVNDDTLYDTLGMFSVIVNYILPFFAVLILNSTIIYRLCQRGMLELTSSITLMLMLVCFVHLFCTLPFQCWWIYYEIPDRTGNCVWLEKKVRWRIITFTIRNFNYMANFFLYSCSSKLFRDELRGLILFILIPHSKYQSTSYRRRSIHDNLHRRVSITELVLRRLSRTSDATYSASPHSPMQPFSSSASPMTYV